MKKLFEVKADSVALIDTERKIFETGGQYFDEGLRTFEPDEALLAKLLENVPKADEGYTSFSTEEVEYEIDDVFGRFGFKDKSGRVVIEPQYASIGYFSNDLCNVCLNRTWYTTASGDHYYETHWGYIDRNGKTVIPFKFREAGVFNKYGVAVLSDEYSAGGYLIDTTGNAIENTAGLDFSFYYDDDSRFFEFTPLADRAEDENEDNTGLYDTKARRVIFPPTAESFSESGDDIITVYYSKRGPEYIDSRGNSIFDSEKKLYDWLTGFEFDNVWNICGHFTAVFKIYSISDEYGKGRYLYGLIVKERGIAVEAEYEKISYLGGWLFACYKSGTARVLDIS